MSELIGFPYKPEIIEPGNCGPAVLAALLGVDTGEAMALMDKHYKNGWHGYTNVGHIRGALAAHDISMRKVNLYNDMKDIPYQTEPILFLIQIEGPWIGKGWRAEYTRTHWILIHKDRIMDINNPKRYSENPQRPNWETREYWQLAIIPGVVRLYKNGTGWHIKACYHVTEGN